MAKHLWRVLATRPNGTESRWHYQTPKAAEVRGDKLREGRRAMLNEATAAALKTEGKPWPTEVPTNVVITKSHPITFPHPAGDATQLDIPED